MPDYKHALIIICVMGIVTFATRIVPVLIFGRGEDVPDYIMYLGRVVPYTAMGLLIVYCLRNTGFDAASMHALPELAAMSAVVLSYLWKRNTIISVVLGTAIYMALI